VQAKQAKLTPALLKSIEQFLFDGFDNDDIAFYHALDVKTVDHIRKGQNFPAIRRGVLAQKARYIALIRDGKGKGWARIAWFLERRYPREFARPDIQLSLAPTSITNNTLVVTAEVADAIISRSKRMTREVDTLLRQKRPVERDQQSDLREDQVENENDSTATR
jgi:hypothetical protein